MRRWGVLITAFYALILVVLLLPGAWLIAGAGWREVYKIYASWLVWVWAAALIGGMALLLFTSVDTSRRKLKPRQHVLVSIAAIAAAVALLTFGLVWSLLAAQLGDRIFEETRPLLNKPAAILGWWLALWAVWAVIFGLYAHGTSERLSQRLNWLLAGSVLELLVVVPCHVISRQRPDCRRRW